MLRPIFYGAVFSPPSCAVQMTAMTIGLELNTREVNLLKGEHLTNDFRKLNPLQLVPVLDDNGFILHDSHAIMTYLVGKYSKNDALYSKDLNNRAMIDQMLYFNSSVLSARTKDAFLPLLQGRRKDVSTESQQLVRKSCDQLNELLSGKKWLVGEAYSLADISCCTQITYLKNFFPIDIYPNIVSWMENCQAQLPGFKEITVSGAAKMQAIIDRKLKK